MNRLMEIANRKGKPFYFFISETLEHALRVYNAGLSLEDVVDFYEFMDLYRSLGAKIVSNDAFSYFVSRLYKADKDSVGQKWYEFGRLCGKSLMAKYADPITVLEKFLAIKEWELNEVSVVRSEKNVKIKCISSILSDEATDLLARFIDGIMHELNYKTERRECLKGIISLEYNRA